MRRTEIDKNTTMNIEKQISYWLDSSEHDLAAAEALFVENKFDWCLYIAHLVLEKAMKAVYVRKTGILAPRTHNLLLLAENSHLDLSQDQKLLLERTNDFNREARYPDDTFSF